ncbi:polysaccharide lyase 8 family protein [uncultured Cetobacterium sp.]|uniref:polysaccharide lyase 8 family protein n=3 Tax=uncultured Cetobacterium sp. TaxID=527638 RepID=UPI00260FCAC4|nr:polysaccharide lyase 8 family protein [uncultured Cetobacterium sp.]
MKNIFKFILFFLLSINSFSETSQEYATVISRFTKFIVPQSNNDYKSSELIKTINKNSQKKYLWKEFKDMKHGPDILLTYRNIFELCKSYNYSQSQYYKNNKVKDIILESLKWMRVNAYQEGFPELGNWWQWEIGIPKELNKIITAMFIYIPENERNLYLQDSRYFQPYAKWSGYSESAKFSSAPHKRISMGGNRIDTAFIVFMRGILSNNKDEVSDALNSIGEVGDYVTHGNGFYKDGSFIQHDTLPYGGTYGAVLLNGLGIIQYLVSDTPLEIQDKRFNNIYESILTGYNYMIVNGRISDSISGRAITRVNSNDMLRGEENLLSIAMISKGAPLKYKEKLKELVKRNILENNLYYLPDKTKNPIEKKVLKDIMRDNSIQIKEIIGTKNFSNMDRVVSRNKNYSFILSMNSNRVGNFESILGENLRGWHTSDGMSYLYTPNKKEYFDFWPTVDPYHLPGTTESLTFRRDGKGQRRVKKYMVKKDFVGGSTDGTNAIIGMDFSSWNDKTLAKKSWFILSDKIIAIGNVDSSDGEVHTTVENKILEDKSQVIENNSKKLIVKNNISNLYTGYFSLNNNNLISKIENRSGSWKEIGGTGTNDKIIKKYILSYIDHGINPQNKTYAYIIFPETSLNNLNEFQKNNIKILSQTKRVHGLKVGNILGINFWYGGEEIIEGIKGKTPLSLIVYKNKKNIEIYASDPTHKNGHNATLEIYGNFSLKNKNSNIKLSNLNGITKIIFKNLKDGATEKMILQKF